MDTRRVVVVSRMCALCFLLCAGQASFAATTTGAVTEGMGTATATQITTPVSTSINPNAGKGKDSQSGGSAANMAAMAALMAACMATQPPNMALCMMGAMAGMQGGHDKDAAGQSAATQAVSGPGSTNATAAADPTYQSDAASTASVKDKQAIAAGLATLKAAGYTASPTGITGADGKSIPAASFGSSGAMVAAGLDPNQVKEAQKVVEKVNADLMSRYGKMGAIAEGTGGGSGGGGYGDIAPASADEGNKSGGGLNNPFAINDKTREGMMAGKTVEFDGERIGVKGDDIFNMVHSAYVRKTAGKHFIETDHDPELNTRAPAAAAAARAMPTLPKK